MIIGLAGQKGSGKDTIAAYLVKKYGFQRRAFADPLKKSVAELLDIPFHEVDKYKNDAEATISVNINGNQLVSIFTMREFLQRYGTESHRNVFGEDFWLEHCLPMNGFYAGKKIVITDLRFANEARRVKFFNGIVVKINRNFTDAQSSHPSENIDVFPDYMIDNDGTIDDLFLDVEELLERVGAASYA